MEVKVIDGFVYFVFNNNNTVQSIDSVDNLYDTLHAIGCTDVRITHTLHGMNMPCVCVKIDN